MTDVPADESTRLFEVSAETVDRPPEHPPETYWRTGFTLPAVAEAFAYPRAELVDSLLETLRDGESALLVGPRGCGKSTLCKQVVTRWLDDDVGAVWYGGGSQVATADESGRPTVAAADATDRTLLVIEDALRRDPRWLAECLEDVLGTDSVSVLVEARQGKLAQFGERPAYTDDVVAECRRLLGGDRFKTVAVPAVDEDDLESIAGYFGDLVDVDVASIPQSVTESADAAVGDEWLQITHALTTESADGNTLDRTVRAAYEALHEPDADPLRRRIALAVNLCNAARIPCSDAVLYELGEDAVEDSRRSEGAEAVEDPEPSAVEGTVEEAVEEAVRSLAGSVLIGADGDEYLPPHEIWSAVYVRQLVERESPSVARERFAAVVDAILSVANEPPALGAEGESAGNSLIRNRSANESSGVGALVTTTPTHTQRASLTVASVLTRLGEFGKQWPVLAPLYLTGPGHPLEIPASCAPLTRAKFVAMQGEIQLERGELDAAGAFFDEAMAIVRDADATPQQREKASVHYHLNRSKIAERRGEHEDAVGHLDDAREIAANLGYRLGEAKALLQLGSIRSKQGDVVAAFEHHEESLAAFRAVGDQRMSAGVLKEMGNLQFRRGDYDGASENYERALDVYRRLGDRKGEARCLSNLGVVATYQERFDAAREYQQRSLGLREQTGATAEMAAALNNLGIVERRDGNLGAAREYYERSLEIKRETGDREGVASSLGNLGVVHREMGDLEQAEAYDRQSLEIYEEIGAPRNQAKCLNDIARIYTEQGRYKEARETLEEALANFEGSDDGGGVGRSTHWLGVVAEEQGDLETALARFERSFDSLADAGTFEAVEVALRAVRVARTANDPDRAATLYEAAREYADASGFEESLWKHVDEEGVHVPTRD